MQSSALPVPSRAWLWRHHAGCGFPPGSVARGQAHADPGSSPVAPSTARWARGRNARRPDAGCRPRPRQDLAEDERQALRPHHAQDQAVGAKATPEGIEVTFAPAEEGGTGAAPTTWCCRPWAHPQRKKIAAEPVAVTERASSTCIQMRTKCRTSSPSATSSASPCWRIHEAHVPPK
jgi:hypothetical protein